MQIFVKQIEFNDDFPEDPFVRVRVVIKNKDLEADIKIILHPQPDLSLDA